MKYRPQGEWRLFQTVMLKKFFKRIMRPRTHSQVHRTQAYMSAAYLISTMILFHRLVYKANKDSAPTTALEKAVNLNISEAKIVTIKDGHLEEVLDYRREDYPELIENRPAYARQ